MNLFVLFMIGACVAVPLIIADVVIKKRDRARAAAYDVKLREATIPELAELARAACRDYLPSELARPSFVRSDWSVSSLLSDIVEVMDLAAQRDVALAQGGSREGALFACYDSGLVGIREELERRAANPES